MAVQEEGVELAIPLLTGQQKKPPLDKALRSGIGRIMLQVSVSCNYSNIDHDMCS